MKFYRSNDQNANPIERARLLAIIEINVPHFTMIITEGNYLTLADQELLESCVFPRHDSNLVGNEREIVSRGLFQDIEAKQFQV